MKNWMAGLIASLLVLAPPMRGQVPQETWVGGIAAGGFIGIRLNLSPGAGAETATIDFTNQGPEMQGIAVLNFVADRRGMRGEWNASDGHASFDAVRKSAGGEDVLEGSFAQGSQTGRIYLVRGARVERDEIQKHFGLYQSNGQYLWLGPVSELNRRPAFINVASGRLGALYPRSHDDFTSGKNSLIPFPTAVRAHIAARDDAGRATRVSWTEGGNRRLATRLDAYTTEEVTFANDTVRLAGTVIIPRGKGPFPAVVFIHGSGGSTREYFSSLPYLLAARGVASLIYDKRGSGQSTGNRHFTRFTGLADDALAAVRTLRARGDIDSAHIGLYGHSQGGWVAPLAASRANGAVAFVAAIAGPAQNFHLQTNDEIEQNILEAGYGTDAARQAIAYQELFWRVYAHEAPYAELKRLGETIKTAPWFRYTFNTKTEGDVEDINLDPPGAYDPTPILAHLKVPILAVYGGRDNRVLGDKNARLMRHLLERAGNRDVTVKVYPTGNHDMIETSTGSGDLATKRYAAGYLSFLTDWLVRHAGGTRRRM